MKDLFNRLEGLIGKSSLAVPDNNFGTTYVNMIIQKQLSVIDIDFDAFTYEDIEEVAESLEDCITDENEDEEISLDPTHHYTRMYVIGHTVSRLANLKNIKRDTTYQFI
ncbi:hypothetical protein [Cytobacillus purgationiresistens]|uniref:Uncharacterized protein n=1 Tax=Cytobacillus purgationiresistens TaxID=863449 RepID=A0ABU0AQL7_9BACI|nr:hypothetical protein [Cytobacillus purgationiresistens]MDQ0273503.1 hypothetical protein [Cytobacillus purgationiresistens]